MSIGGADINLQIALTVLQFIALALPAIYLFAQVRDYDFSSSTRQLIRMSVVSYVVGAVAMLVAIVSNIQSSPGGTFHLQWGGSYYTADWDCGHGFGNNTLRSSCGGVVQANCGR